MLLRGDLVRCGPGVRGIAWPDTPTVRLTALAPYLLDDRVASHLTAAWVWLATAELAEPVQIATSPQRGHAVRHADSRIAQLAFAEHDTERLGDFLVTTPARTAFDLLHDPALTGSSSFAATRRLLRLVPDRGAALSEQLARERRPYTRLARKRFATIIETPRGSLP